LSVRLKLTLSYAGFLMVAGALMLAAAWLASQDRQSVLVRYIPDGAIDTVGALVPGNHAFLLRAFAPAAAVAQAFLLVFGLVGGWFLAGRMLAPLTRITHATRTAASGSLSHRIDLEGRNDEFRELADAFDSMLARLEVHVNEQRRFAANASHELRTPLAISQTLLEVVRNDPDSPASELVDRLHAVNARAIDLTEALLLLSRTDQRTFSREPVDLSLAAEEAGEALLPLAERLGVTVETSAEIAPALGSHALLVQLATNLLHNAIVHNLAEHGAVWVTTGARQDRAVLVVENTGDEVAPEVLSTLTEPFQRGSERVRTDHAGVGLGLAIVKSIAHAHDGTLTLTPRDAGGLRVTVELPAALAPTVATGSPSQRSTVASTQLEPGASRNGSDLVPGSWRSDR
jgi:two-component system sensor histidine kinase VanS